MAPDSELWCCWKEASGGHIAIVTLSPEWEGSVDFIRKYTLGGVAVDAVLESNIDQTMDLVLDTHESRDERVSI